jgi:hypothetical protein
MATIIKPKKSETASAVPSTSDLAVGELAMNTADQKMYTKNSSNVIVEVASGGGITEATATAKAIVMAVALG